MTAERTNDQAVDERAFTITRTFDAPRDLVFSAFSEAEHLAKWWGPKGANISVASLDFRPGGMFHYSMQAPGGPTLWGRFMYEEIAAPEKLVFVSAFSDENGGLAANPFMPVWPLEVQNTFTFADEGNGKTTLTGVGLPVNATPEQMEAFARMRPMLSEGFKGTWEKLDEFLKNEMEAAAGR